ncbi:hypothetical protein VNO78_33737 [Psophocarpus tetragonolobus]|uniref:Uncharacterized protein n=1 Tax=Psophocarpus tetragonolobus TaxID=3891 RepID=A0AAN9NXR9_PSOTE
MCWSLVILFLSLTCGISEASNDRKLPSTVVVGTVFCDTCFHQEFSTKSHFISGALVEVECKVGNSAPTFKKEVKTNEHGEFKVKLPFKVWKHAKIIKGCTFKLISSSEPHCAVASFSTSSSVSLKTRNQGENIFSAGSFSFKPIEKPQFCNHNSLALGKTRVLKSIPTESSDKSQSDNSLTKDTFFPFPPLPFPPFPFPPIPMLPPLPFLPPFPFLPPNPFQPPMSPAPVQPISPPLNPPTPFQPPISPTPIEPISPPLNPPTPFQPPLSPDPIPPIAPPVSPSLVE